MIFSTPLAPRASAELTLLTVSLNCHTGGRRPSFLAVSLSVFLLVVTLFSARHGSAMRAARGCNVPALGGRHAGPARPEGNDRETREFLKYFTPHVFELQELGLLFISQRRRQQRRTQNKRPTHLQGLGTLGMHAKRNEKGG